jgi:hypothetical protein
MRFPQIACAAIDPCVGDGVAFEAITSGAKVLRYGIEPVARTRQSSGRLTKPALTVLIAIFLARREDFVRDVRASGARPRAERRSALRIRLRPCRAASS